MENPAAALSAAAVLLPYLMRQGRDSQPGTAQPGIGVYGEGTLRINGLDGGANRLGSGGMSGRVPAQPQREISLQRMPGEAPRFACIVHIVHISLEFRQPGQPGAQRVP